MLKPRKFLSGSCGQKMMGINRVSDDLNSDWRTVSFSGRILRLYSRSTSSTNAEFSTMAVPLEKFVQQLEDSGIIDFVTLADDHHMGIKLKRESGSDGEISVYFGKGVTQQEQVIFANYIHAHLQTSCEKAPRLRHYVCPKCHAPKGNPEVLMKKLLREKQNADTECDDCGKRFPLWDSLEKKFASEAVRAQVEQLQADDLAKLDTRRRGKLLALEVGARITSADQKCFEIPATEDEGLDMELEFTNDDGQGTGHRLYLQLKSGNSYLTKRKTDGAEIFKIKKQRWVEYWRQQPHPVMLVIGTFSEDGERTSDGNKLQFAEVRWMEITSVLNRESENGTKPLKQIEFKGERLDLSSVRRWRDKVLASAPI